MPPLEEVPEELDAGWLARAFGVPPLCGVRWELLALRTLRAWRSVVDLGRHYNRPSLPESERLGWAPVMAALSGAEARYTSTQSWPPPFHALLGHALHVPAAPLPRVPVCSRAVVLCLR